MKNSHEPNYAARLSEAAKAKQGLLERVRKDRTENAAEVTARQAVRQAHVDAKRERAAEQKAARQAEKLRKAAALAAKEEALAAVRAAERERLEAEAEEKKILEARLATEQKAARDARYAARKARKR